MHGTYKDLSTLSSFISEEPLLTPIPSQLPPRITLPGKPLSAIDTEEHQHEDDDDEKDQYEPHNDYESGSVVIETFIISSEIKNIDDFLTGPVQHNMQNAAYLKLIPKMTDTICTLNGRSIKIEGSPDDVRKAYQKFAVIQKTFIGMSKKTSIPCLHFHNPKTFRLYFCNLPRYRYHAFVQHRYEKSKSPADYHVILPVFLDKTTNEYINPPKDLIMGNSEQHTSSKPDDLDKTMRPVQDAMKQIAISQKPSQQPYQSSSHSSTVRDLPESSGRFQPPSWGLDRNFTTAYNTGGLEYFTSKRLVNAFTPTPPPPLPTASKLPMLKDFPLLPTGPRVPPQQPADYKPLLRIGSEPKPRRVLRIVNQKAASSSTPSASPLGQLDRVRIYNYHNIKTTLTKGLESVRGFKGELKLYAKIGKVLWNVGFPKEVTTKIWEYDEIIDIVMKEYNTTSNFTNMTTKDERIINLFASPEIIRDAHFASKTAIYEFHCLARNSPSLPYKPTVIHMNQGVIDVRKVVLSEQTVAEVDWVSLDRRYDFKLALTAKQLARCDVKPYTTFIKWISVCPITRQMSFENVPNFLKVDHVIFKQTTRYTYVLPFIIDIIRVEKVPLVPVANSRKINAFPGSGEAWYDFEIHNTINQAPFKSNMGLEIGSEASWTVQDILQSNNTEDTITNYVKNMITLIERIENAIKKMPQ
ncbi:hypothetical protein [Parasitella parasitica]|uniref:DUF7905 domain-containing protein n=1 Tax=Parasitella parasitica TaxID=35722 RepID=A0A0B7MYK1_9FUNG|nr:hypothetical protein [Parasitella parasitica]